MGTSIRKRQATLTSKLNKFISHITGVDKDYFASFSNQDFIALKYALSTINNILTLKVALAFIDFISKLFSLTDDEKASILNKFDSTSPNANGYDIDFITNGIRVLIEIKSTVPINQGDRFGIAQINSILDDAIKLHYGKGKIQSTDAYKFIGILDLGESTDKALEAVFKQRTLRVKNESREKRNLIKTKLKLLDKTASLKSISKDYVYIVKVAL